MRYLTLIFNKREIFFNGPESKIFPYQTTCSKLGLTLRLNGQFTKGTLGTHMINNVKNGVKRSKTE